MQQIFHGTRIGHIQQHKIGTQLAEGDKTYRLSLEQLNDIVSDAVTNALKKLDNIEIVEEQTKEQPAVKVGEFTDEQYREAIATMERNRGKG